MNQHFFDVLRFFALDVAGQIRFLPSSMEKMGYIFPGCDGEETMYPAECMFCLLIAASYDHKSSLSLPGQELLSEMECVITMGKLLSVQDDAFYFLDKGRYPSWGTLDGIWPVLRRYARLLLGQCDAEVTFPSSSFEKLLREFEFEQKE